MKYVCIIIETFFVVHPKLDLVNFAVRPILFTKSCSSLNQTYSKKFQMLFEQNIASNVTRNAGVQTYKT